ncbi:heme exporter protein CcmD [Phyllobacterium zundukense]|uniref:Heme exporter protein D n=1 Tax=Phyllobacterium zundukense TaxID=1867719 RepID=A0A2N9VWP3_9HYPH|nr:heme exporter protein CcmD [Phyllobacterium zundukense]ATU93485.1 heme exporter protein CcmD [Phyllobacterium zundukense]PIO43911.1 heme exporter protein CcmD [Phyllobacterium zundukense]
MMSHTGFVLASYSAALIVLAGLIGWIFMDQRIQRRALLELESRGVRRRSETKMDSAS